MKNKTNCIYRFNGFQLEVDEGLLKKGQEIIPLTPKAFETLVVLLDNRGKVVDKDTLLEEVWQDTYVGETTLAQNILTLRKTLGLSENGEQLIETVPKRGYKFVAGVSKIIGGNGAESAIFERNSQNGIVGGDEIIESKNLKELQSDETTSESRKSKERKSTFLQFLPKNYARLLMTGFLLIVIISLSFGLISYFQTQKSAETTAPSINSIAVLPLYSLDEQSKKEMLGFRMADAIISRLSSLQRFPIRPTSAIFRYLEQPVSTDTITAGRDLDVDAILEGTVQRDGERIRVSIQLVNATDGNTLWAESFNEESANIFALQDSISSKVAQSLALKLTPDEQKRLEARPTNNREAFEAYQLGVYLWNTRTQENLQTARRYFEKAIEFDPEFAAAYAMLADTQNLIGYYTFSNRDEMYKEVSINAARALALDNSIAEAFMAMASVHLHERNVNAAESYLVGAIERAPYNSTVRVRYAWVLLRLGKTDQAVSEMRMAHEFDPISPVTNGALCNMLTYQENFPEAVKVCRRAVELSPDTADNRLALANAYFFNGNTIEAIEQAKIDMERGEEKSSALGSIGYFYAKLGRRAEAEAILAQLKPEAEKNTSLLVDLAVISYALNKKDESFAYFKKAYEKKLLSILIFRSDPVWKDIRQDSRFVALINE